MNDKSLIEPAGKMAATPAFRPLVPLNVLRFFVLAMLALKLAFAFLVPPNADGAYYFLWGQHLQLSYLDHPLMVGWAEGLSERLFGWNFSGLRFPTLVAAAATLGLFHAWARKLSPDNAKIYFWTLTGVYFCSPMFIFTSTNVLPDNWLVLFLLVCAYFLSDFMAAWRESDEKSYKNLYLAAVFMGLAGLSKYNALFFGLAFLGVLVCDRRLRGLFRTPQLYLAGLLVAVILSPIAIWNFHHHFGTVALHAANRFDRDKSGFDFMGLPREAFAVVGFGPFLMPALYRFLRTAPAPGAIGALYALGKWSFVLSTVFMLALGSWAPATKQVIMHWSDVSFIPLVAVIPFFCVSPRLLKAHLAVGTLGFALITFVYVFNPLAMRWIGRPSYEASRFGEDVAAAAAARAMAQTHASFIVTPHWSEAAQLAFGAGSDRDITTFDHRVSQFDYWRDEKDLRGKDAILVLRGRVAPAAVTAPFKSVAPYAVVTAMRFGLPVSTYSLFVARGFIGRY